MAISRGSGTEVIRCVTLKEIDSTGRPMIVGVQHHIYTVLSIIVYAQAVNAAGDYVSCYLTGYDANAGTSGENMNIFLQDMSAQQTFVFNEKFSFNGYEPVDFTGPMDDATKQDAIADQGSSVGQKLQINGEHASDNFNVYCTFIDQNNS
jgi:hypothetical protein